MHSKLASILLLLSFFSCMNGVASAVDLSELKQIDQANPKQDFNEAISKKDYRFIGILGYALEVPGVPNYNEKYSRNGVRIIKGTSDVIESEEHGRLIQKAREYSLKYNQYLLKLLIKHKMK